jgi:hypothetical protein
MDNNMRCKSGVKLNGIKPEMLVALMVAESVYNERQNELVITSVVDGKHSPTSLHYVGYGMDLRTRGLVSPESVAGDIKESLTDEFDVIFEGDHIHIEFQPKGGR